MEPKFQSSFIPKGPAAFTNTPATQKSTFKERNFFSFISFIIFILSILLALGVFGSKFYLKYRINQMGVDLKAIQVTLEPATIDELMRLNGRLTLGQTLVSNHRVLTPLFEFLETFTPAAISFKDFNFNQDDKGLVLSLRGEAQSYSALAFLSDIFNKSEQFKNPFFSNLSLNEKGNVNFSFQAVLDQDFLSYKRQVEDLTPSVISN